jgi:hypothetical protein
MPAERTAQTASSRTRSAGMRGLRLTRCMGQTRTGLHGRSLQKLRRRVCALTAQEREPKRKASLGDSRRPHPQTPLALEPKRHGRSVAAGQLVHTRGRSRPAGYARLMTAERLVTRSARSMKGGPARGLPIPTGPVHLSEFFPNHRHLHHSENDPSANRNQRLERADRRGHDAVKLPVQQGVDTLSQ